MFGPGRGDSQGRTSWALTKFHCCFLPCMEMFIGCLVAGSKCLLWVILSLSPSLGHKKHDAEASQLLLNCNAKTYFPKWVAGVSWFTVAVAVLICESQQPTPPSRDFRAVEPPEGCLCGSGESAVCAVTSKSPGLSETLGLMEATSGLRQGQASCEIFEFPLPFCAQ